MPLDHQHTLRLAARAMARHGLAHAYGHVSIRLDEDNFLASPPCPLGAVSIKEKGIKISLDGEMPAQALPELRIHREIYRQRRDVGGVCRFQSPAVIALSILGRTPRALHGLGTYFAPFPPLWPHTELVRNDLAAEQVANMIGSNAAIVLRGNGSVTAGKTLQEAASFAYFLEDAARIELSLLSAEKLGLEPQAYTDDEVKKRAIRTGALIDRMWHFLCLDDPEWSTD